MPDIGEFEDVPVIEMLVSAGRHGQRGAVTAHAGKRQGDHGSAGACRTACPGAARGLNDTVSEGDVVAVLDADPADGGC